MNLDAYESAARKPKKGAMRHRLGEPLGQGLRVARYRWASIFQPSKRGTYRRQKSGVRVTIQSHAKPY